MGANICRSVVEMEKNRSPTRTYDESSRLWYEVHWDDNIERFVWNISPHQQLIEEAKTKKPVA
jgi:hypothetical protein